MSTFRIGASAPSLRLITIIELDDLGRVLSSSTRAELIDLGERRSAAPSDHRLPALSGEREETTPPVAVPSYSSCRDPVSPSPARDVAWRDFLQRVIARGNLWEGFAGLDAASVMEFPGVGAEVRGLQLCGVHNALELVLRFGAERVAEVRKWAQRKEVEARAGGRAIKSVACLISSTLFKGRPKGARLV